MSASYTLIGEDGKPYESQVPGTLGGHRRNKVYGRLDCAGALRWIAKGHYVKQRVFFADEATAIAAGLPAVRELHEGGVPGVEGRPGARSRGERTRTAVMDS